MKIEFVELLSKLYVGEAVGGLFDGFFVFEELGQGVIFRGGQCAACGIGQGDGEGNVGVVNLEGVDIDGDARLGGFADEFRESGDVGMAGADAGHSEGGGVAEENFRKRFGDDSAVAGAVDGLGGVLARGAAAEIGVGEKDGGSFELAVVERVIGDFAGLGIIFDVVEHAFGEVVESDALHEASWDDAVGVDIVTENRNGGAGDLGNSG